MTEFWKSNPKKFCEFCRVWFADNKSSIDFHERGKKHQENVERKLGELRKKGLKQHEAQQHTNSFLQQMEEDALKAFKKDAEKDSALVTQYNQAACEFKVRQFEEEAANEPKSTTQQQGTWFEGKNKDGHPYYWNDVTGESQWEEPAKFIAHQETTSTTTADDDKDDDDADGKAKPEQVEEKETKEAKEKNDDEIKDGEGGVKKKEEETEKRESNRKGQKRKGDAYGKWTQVVDEDSTPVDLQLPESAKNYMSHYQPQVEQRQPVEEFEFGIKTISSIATFSGEKVSVGFKKRKGKGGGRSLRQREET